MSCGNDVNNKEGIKKGGKKLEKVAIIKKARITGAEYVNHRGMLVPARGQGENCRCMFKCFERCTTKERQEILEKFRHLSSKNKQDSYLQSLLEFSAPKVKRPRNLAEPRPRSFTFKYYLNCTNRIMVCKKAFVSIHAITPARVRRLGLLLTMGKEPDDKRGKNPSGNAIPEHKIQEIEEHIKSFPVKVYQDNKLRSFQILRFHISII
ncbi:unnamed protein product [Brassicogethes aeneus]|uniref:Uncharacterized protein n=1 Tax=Brassicogethes aeneus TaxID=1431903 RepID=A0A9P0AXG0_BRAAE|nr:unnamed protein product [Brassicogethes aeneus]